MSGALTSAYKRYALGTLTAVYMLNLVDRGLVGVLLQPIKQNLNLTDSQLGILTGVAFGLLYAALSLPAARWSDQGNRVTIASAAIALWGMAVMCTLFVGSFFQLVVARAAAAVGEAGCRPPTYSLVGDYFPQPAERAVAMAVYMAGGPISALVSFGLGGWLCEEIGWRETFFVMGFPGLLLAATLKWTLREPRVIAAQKRDEPSPLPSLQSVVRIIWRQRTTRHLCAALMLLYMLGYGVDPWYAAFMSRSHAMSTAEIGIWLGLVLSTAGIVGLLLGGYASSRWLKNERIQLKWSAFVVMISVACFTAFLTLPTSSGALIALIPTQISCIAFIGPVLAVLQRVVPDNARATTLALAMLVANLVGMSIGPQIVGTLSDRLAPIVGSDSLRYAMLAVCVGYAWPAYHLLVASRTVLGDLAECQGPVGARVESSASQ